MKKFLPLITLLTLGLTLTPAKAGFTKIPTSITTSGWNFNDGSGPLSSAGLELQDGVFVPTR